MWLGSFPSPTLPKRARPPSRRPVNGTRCPGGATSRGGRTRRRAAQTGPGGGDDALERLQDLAVGRVAPRRVSDEIFEKRRLAEGTDGGGRWGAAGAPSSGVV